MVHRRNHYNHSLLNLDAIATGYNHTPAKEAARRKVRNHAGWAPKLDVVQQLGGEGIEGYGDGIGVYGHTGCINALNWSSDGTLLASGSDDTKVCLWKLGQEPDYIHPDNQDVVNHYPALGLGLSAVIHTGHRANIFSVKFSPTRNSHIFTAAGDHEVRVFDLSTEASISNSRHAFATFPPREFTEYTTTSGVCTRVLKCHRGRVKRISTEEGSDSTFLTCSEDGTVRQHDLRVGHKCAPLQCPPPLCSYRHLGLGLYSLSTSPLRPELFVVAGTSPYAYLHDRRMIPHTMLEQWGIPLQAGQLTQCVRRFGPAIPPLVPGPPPVEEHSDSEEEEDDEDDDKASLPAEEVERRRVQARRRQARQRARRAQALSARNNENNHVTAAKLSNTNGRELLLTYSGGPICRYDIFDEPELSKKEGPSMSDEKAGRDRRSEEKESKRTEEVQAGQSIPTPANEGYWQRQAKMQRITRGEAAPAKANETSSEFVTHSLQDDPSLVRQSANGQEGHDGEEEEVYGPAPPAESSSASTTAVPERRQRAFEIRVGDDGELEMDVEDAPPHHADSDEDEDSEDTDSAEEMNTQGLQELLRNVASGSGIVEGGSSDEGDEEEDEPEPLPEEEMRRLLQEAEEDDEDEEDEDEEDDISDSDSVPSPPNGGSTIYSEVPLVRPRAIYTGHRNVDTVKDVNLGGGDDSLILSGSDDGNVFIWAKEAKNQLIGIWKGDESVVNVLQWHPFLPVLAVSGIDNSVKILAPTQGLKDGERRWASRFHKKEEIEKKNQDSTWSSQGLGINPNVLLRLLARRQAQDGDGEDGEEEEEGGTTRRQTRRIPLQALLQLAQEGGTDERGDCSIM